MTSNGFAGVRHAVAVYGSDEELCRQVLPFLQEGLAAGEKVVAIVSPQAAAMLREGLGMRVGEVSWHLPGVDYANLGPAVDGLRRYLAAQHESGVRVRLLAENATAGDRARMAGYLRFEAASNDVLGTYGVPWVCLYDRRRYPAQVLEQVNQVHPRMLDPDGRERHSEQFLAPDRFLHAHPGPLSTVPPEVEFDAEFSTAGHLSGMRRAASSAAAALGLDPRDDDDFQLAANEALTNALRHGERPCRARMWATDTHIALRVNDQGDGDNMAVKGFRPPDPATSHFGGMGLWMMRHLADTVQIATGPDGTAVELRFIRRPGPG